MHTNLKFNEMVFIVADENDLIAFAGRCTGRARPPYIYRKIQCNLGDSSENANSDGSSFLRPEEHFKKSKGETTHDEHKLQPNRN